MLINRQNLISYSTQAVMKPRFGMNAEFPPKHYEQTETVGTVDRRIVHNCSTCTVYNLLSYLGLDGQVQVETEIDKMLKLMALPGTLDMSQYIAVGTTTSGQRGYGVTPACIHLFLNQLGIRTRAYSQPFVDGNQTALQQAMESRCPLIIADRNTTTLAGRFTMGHMYCVYPGQNKGQWFVADSRDKAPLEIPECRLLEKINDSKTEFLVIEGVTTPLRTGLRPMRTFSVVASPVEPKSDPNSAA